MSDRLQEALARNDDDRTTEDWNLIDAAARESIRLRTALKPSVETKAAYIGEFTIPLPDLDDTAF